MIGQLHYEPVFIDQRILPNYPCLCNPSLSVKMIRTLCAEVAQLVEQLIRNEQVVGSSPIFGSICEIRIMIVRLLPKQEARV